MNFLFIIKKSKKIIWACSVDVYEVLVVCARVCVVAYGYPDIPYMSGIIIFENLISTPSSTHQYIHTSISRCFH